MCVLTTDLLEVMMELKKTLNMPKGSFEMRGKLPTREPIYIERYEHGLEGYDHT